MRVVFAGLHMNSLIMNFKKYSFITDSLVFLSYVVSDTSISVDEEKNRVMKEWPTLQKISDAPNFLVLTTLYRRFVRNFSTITAPHTDYLKKN